LLFFEKTSIHDENKLKICISSLWGPYSCSVRHYGVLHKFLFVLKTIEFRLKTQRVSLRFFKKHLFAVKVSRKSIFHPRKTHIFARLHITVLYTIFRAFKKYRVSTQNSKGSTFDFNKKHLFTTKSVKNSYFNFVMLIFFLG
jgi:hypothetical protein